MKGVRSGCGKVLGWPKGLPSRITAKLKGICNTNCALPVAAAGANFMVQEPAVLAAGGQIPTWRPSAGRAGSKQSSAPTDNHGLLARVNRRHLAFFGFCHFDIIRPGICVQALNMPSAWNTCPGLNVIGFPGRRLTQGFRLDSRLAMLMLLSSLSCPLLARDLF